MKYSFPFAFFLPICLVLSLASGCAAVFFKAQPGSPLETGKIQLIKPGVTTFSEILALFGPPDFIIDGTKQMVDFEALDPRGDRIVRGRQIVALRPLPVPTRVLTAPEGTVLLIYSEGGGSFTQVSAVNPIIQGQALLSSTEQRRADEFFVYISKKDRTVVTIVGSGRDEK